MKIQKIAYTLMVVLLATGNVYADAGTNSGNRYTNGQDKIKVKDGGQQGGAGSPHVVPEIDAASGTSALALLTGILLLAGERVRSKSRSTNSRNDDA